MVGRRVEKGEVGRVGTNPTIQMVFAGLFFDSISLTFNCPLLPVFFKARVPSRPLTRPGASRRPPSGALASRDRRETPSGTRHTRQMRHTSAKGSVKTPDN